MTDYAEYKRLSAQQRDELGFARWKELQLPWTKFSDRLPSQEDADPQGLVWALETAGTMRLTLWNWIQPIHSNAADLWAINGFIGWRPNSQRTTP